MISKHVKNSVYKRRIQFAVTAAALGAALVEGLVVWGRGMGGMWSGNGGMGALVCSFLTFGTLAILSSVLCWGLERIVSPKSMYQQLSKPMGTLVSAIRGADEETTHQIERLIFKLVGYLVFVCVVCGIAFWAISSFKEPLRISLLIGVGTVVVGLPLRYGVLMLMSKLSRRLNLSFSLKQNLVRIASVPAILLMVGTAVSLALYRHEIFGAIDPLPAEIAMIFALFILLLSHVGHRVPIAFFDRVTKISPAIWGLIAGIIGATLVTISPAGRMHVDVAGAVGGVSFKVLHRLLDFDNDGSAWLIGGDCRPFDAQSGPFAEEIPGNGVDENCDGLDTAVASVAVDPLSSLPPIPKKGRVENGNVLLIISDATAAKHLKMYGYGRDTMPHLERFAKKAAVFRNSFSVGNHTSIAMPSLLTGRFPSTFPNVESLGWHSFRLSKKANPIQLRLRRKGYRTHMIAGHQMNGFLRHFDKVKNVKAKHRKAEAVTDEALKFLKTIGPNPKKPAFVGVHYIDPHHPYTAPDSKKYGKKNLDKYDAELSYVDASMAPILSLMNTKDYRDWLVIVTADHGEGFFEHHFPHHGHTLFDEEVRVPLIIRVPHFKPSTVTTAVSHLDLVPTILDWIGTAADRTLFGHSLLPLAAPGAKSGSIRRVVYSEFFRTGGIFGAFDGRFAMMYHRRADVFELYDGKKDPAQKNNVFGKGEGALLEKALRVHVQKSLRRLKSALSK